MNFDISVKDDYEVIKDGLIVAEEDDHITFKFDDLTFIFRIYEIKEGCERCKSKSEDKTIEYPVYISWDNINTTFSKRIEMATFEENSQKKSLYLSYAITGLKGKDLCSYIFRYTWYSKNS